MNFVFVDFPVYSNYKGGLFTYGLHNVFWCADVEYRDAF